MTLRSWSALALAALSAGACGKAAADLGGAEAGAGSSSGGASSSGGGAGASSGGGTGGDDGAESSDAGTGADSTLQDDAAPAVTCSGPFLAPGDYVRTISTDAGVRTYYVHVPASAVGPGPAPLVLAFHGGGMTVYGDGGLGFELFAHVRGKSDSAGFVLIEPEGTPALPLTQPGTLDVFNAGNCCEQAEQKNSNIDDVGFVSAILDAIGKETCIDTRRVFATGLSNGAMLSHRLACQLSDKIAAIAAVSGGLGNRDYDTVGGPTTLFPCTPTRPVPDPAHPRNPGRLLPLRRRLGPALSPDVRGGPGDDRELGRAQRLRGGRTSHARLPERRGLLLPLRVPEERRGRAVHDRRRRPLLAGRRRLGRQRVPVRLEPGRPLGGHPGERRALDVVPGASDALKALS